MSYYNLPLYYEKFQYAPPLSESIFRLEQSYF